MVLQQSKKLSVKLIEIFILSKASLNPVKWRRDNLQDEDIY